MGIGLVSRNLINWEYNLTNALNEHGVEFHMISSLITARNTNWVLTKITFTRQNTRPQEFVLIIRHTLYTAIHTQLVQWQPIYTKPTTFSL